MVARRAGELDHPRPQDAERALARLEADNRALTAQNALLRQLVTVYDQMTGLVLQGADMNAITRRLSELTGRGVRVYDAALQRLASSDGPEMKPGGAWPAADPQIAHVIARLADGRRPIRLPPMPGGELDAGLVIAPIVAGDDVLGYLTMCELSEEAESANLDLLVVQQAATVYALTLTRARLSADVANRLREDLLEGLLLGQQADPHESEHRAALLGYDPRRPYRVLLVRPEGISPRSEPGATEDLALRRRVLDTIVEYLGRVAHEAIAVARSDEVVVLVPASGDGLSARSSAAVSIGESIGQYLRHPYPAVAATIAISAPCESLAGLPAAYEQARRTMVAAHQFGRRGRLTTFEELGIYRLLFQVPSAGELQGFAEEVLGPLAAYDRRHDAGLVRTLDAYLRHHGRLQAAARELVVHVNTVSYRLQRIREIAGLDLDSAEDRLTAQVALKIYEGLEQSPGKDR
jgi:purine catabolism regulator